MAKPRIKNWQCPWCGQMCWGEVIDSRPIKGGQRRKRLCEGCIRFFHTEEKVIEEEANGRTEDC